MKLKIFLAISIFPLATLANIDNAELKKRIEAKVKASGVSASEMTLYVTTGDDEDEVILDVNSKKILIPASVTKVATASAVLDAFPPGSKFKTTLWLDAKPKERTVKGSIYLKGGGDPSFVSENMWMLVNSFLRAGIDRIEGDIVVDDSLFDSVRFDESREDSRVDRAYDAPVGAMSFNWNSINIFVRPGKQGEKGDVFLDPVNGYTKLVNRTKTVKGVANTIAVDREASKDGGDTVIVAGNIGVDREEVVIYKNITRPEVWAGENLRGFLQQRGITVAGKVRSGPVPPGAWQVADADSRPVESILGDMNKFSNNYVAEMLTKNLAAQKQKPAALAKGVEAINEHLKAIGVPEDQMKIVNPSGLTRDNRLSAFALWKVLRHLRADFRVQPEFLTSLPIAGIDGTLKKRMVGTSAERWVRAKTGLLTGVTALAGYAGRKDGRVFTFVFIHNGKADQSRMRRLFDEWLVSLID